MRSYSEAIGKRSVAVSPGRRWPEWISRLRSSRRDRAGWPVEMIQRRAYESRSQQRIWASIPDPRWHRGQR
jgi:hypothetical protein